MSILTNHMRKDATFTLRLRSEVKEAAVQAAADHNRSLANLIETLLVEHCCTRNTRGENLEARV
jgi:hypothetical protein